MIGGLTDTGVPITAGIVHDMGGNATAIGASANVVVLGIAERSRQPVSFWEFTRYGLIVTAATVAVSLAYVWLRYFALA